MCLCELRLSFMRLLQCVQCFSMNSYVSDMVKTTTVGACSLCACVCSVFQLYSSSVSSSVTAGPHQTPYSFSHSTKPTNTYIFTHSDFVHANGLTHTDTHAQVSTDTWREKYFGCDPYVENRISSSGKDGGDLRGMVWRGVGRKKLLDIVQNQNCG